MTRYTLETVPCLLCGSTQHSLYIQDAEELYNGTKEKFNVVRCDECGLVYTNPRPTATSISFFYPDSAGYYIPVRQQSSTGGMDRMRSQLLHRHLGYPLPPHATDISAPLLAAMWVLFRRQIFRQHIPPFIPGGKLLDIGASWGCYMAQMRDLGWEVHGVELNPAAVEHGRSQLGLDRLQQGFLDSVDLEEGTFDVVRMGMVLEHMHDPLATLRRVATLLRPGGRLLLSVPDITGLEARLYGRHAYTLQVPQHLVHFSPRTLSTMLRKAGFKDIRTVHHAFDRDMVSSAEYLPGKRLSRILHNPMIRRCLVRPFIRGLALAGKTSRMSASAIKPTDAPS